MAIDFLYLNEPDMIKAGVLDELRCIEAMRSTISLFGKKDYLLGGPKADEHGLQVNFPFESDIPGFPLDDGPDRRFMAMPAYLGGKYHIAGEKYYGSNSHNTRKGLPRSILMVMLSDVETGAPIALESANLLSAMRTGAMPAMAAQYLAKKDSKVLSIIGPGAIGKCAMNCLLAVLPEIDEIRIKGSSIKSASAAGLVKYIVEKYPRIEKISICSSLQEACEGADVVSEAMSVNKADMEEFKPEWFEPGCTVFSLGSFYFTEYDKLPSVTMVVDNYGMYDKYMKNFMAIGWTDELGRRRKWGAMGMNFVHLVDEGVIAREDVINLADIVNGECGGRKSDDEIIYCSIGGMPLEDLSWGYECYETASKLGIGQNLDLWDEPYLR